MNIPAIDWAIVMPTIVVICVGILGLLIEMVRPKQNNNLIVGVTLAGLGFAFYLLLGQLNRPTASTMGGLVYRDQFSVLLQLVMVGATGMCMLFSEAYLRQKRIAYGEFYPMALWSLSGGMIMVGTQSLLMLFVGLEVLSIALYCLAGMARAEQRSEESALKYFLLGAFASAFLLYGIAFIFGASGTIDLQALGQMYEGEPYSGLLTLLGITMLIIGFGFKAGVVPFHQWTPDVYQGAPTNVTAFMSAVSKIAAVGALTRVLFAAIPHIDIWMPAMTVVAIVTMTLGNLVALVQRDVKRALAYSSIAHAGYLLVGVLAHVSDPEKVSLSSVVFYLVAYSLMTIGAFAVVSLTAKAGKEGTRTSDLRGLWKRAPFAAMALLICLVSLVGVPPTAGFFGKFAIFTDALAAGLTTLAIALAVNSAISAFYYWQIIKAAFIDEEPATGANFAPEGAGIKLTSVIAIVGVVFIGFFSGPVLEVSKRAGTDIIEEQKAAQALEEAERAKIGEVPGAELAPGFGG
ncbi:NADH-quinone oxidoreductase subunit N [Kamptonema cortianum]|nr:NADH-quinone oxidoreductase subunit N [Geitlerinema splendidum]MDK3162513.1 NADH-quinone oxidoreductase subunit N [Kamptonema cortianum]